MIRWIGEQLDALAVDDTLLRTENPLNNAGKWLRTWFANNIGKATLTGWVTITASTWAGAAWVNESLSQIPAALKVTLAVQPATNNTQLYLGLYGYETAAADEDGFFVELKRTAANTYYVRLFSRVAEAVTTHAEVAGKTLATGDVIALSYDGVELMALRKNAGVWTKLLGAKGLAALNLIGARAQIAASGATADTTYRLSNFAAGPLIVAESSCSISLSPTSTAGFGPQHGEASAQISLSPSSAAAIRVAEEEAIAAMQLAAAVSGVLALEAEGTAAMELFVGGEGVLALSGEAEAPLQLQGSAEGNYVRFGEAAGLIELAGSKAEGEAKGPRMRASGNANIAYVEGPSTPRYPRGRY